MSGLPEAEMQLLVTNCFEVNFLSHQADAYPGITRRPRPALSHSPTSYLPLTAPPQQCVDYIRHPYGVEFGRIVNQTHTNTTQVMTMSAGSSNDLHTKTFLDLDQPLQHQHSQP